VFVSAGIREADAEQLRAALLAAARNGEAQAGGASQYGQ